MIVFGIINIFKPIYVGNQKFRKFFDNEYAYGIFINKDILNKNHRLRTNIDREVKYIVIHETANTKIGADAKAHNEYIKNMEDGRMVSWHYTVDDKEIYNHIPDTEVAWHSGTDDGNNHGIAVEIAVNDDGDYEKSLSNASKLTAFLLKRNNLDIDSVKQHADFSGKNCPTIIRETGRWEDFLEMIKDNIK